MWLLLTWFCTNAGCQPLPPLGPMTADDCRHTRPLFVRDTPHAPNWIEGRCERQSRTYTETQP